MYILLYVYSNVHEYDVPGIRYHTGGALVDDTYEYVSRFPNYQYVEGRYGCMRGMRVF